MVRRVRSKPATGRRHSPRAVVPFVLKPSAKRSVLLGSTALAAGVLVGLGAVVSMPRPAMALGSCDSNVNAWSCDGPETASLTFLPSANFSIGFGPTTPFVSSYVGSSAAVAVYPGNFSTTGDGIRFHPGSVVNNSEGDALYLSLTSPSDVTVNINGALESEDAASLIGAVGIDAYASEGGSLTINNDGHIQGTNIDAIFAEGFDLVTVNNYSYGSSVGSGHGDFFRADHQVVVDNRMGLTAGLVGGQGLAFTDIDGLSPATGYAVDVNNTEGGIVAGYSNGINAYNTGLGAGAVATDLRIDNHASYDSGWIPGGLIVGVNANGVSVIDLGGHLSINNDFTMQGSIDLSAAAIDPLVAVDSGLLHDVLPSGFTSGIYGKIDGIYAGKDGVGILDGVDIYNRDGQIVGAEGDGIDFNSVYTHLQIDNGYRSYSTLAGTAYTMGGSIWGGTDGVYGYDSQSVYAYNDLGWITGVNAGIHLSTVGETGIGNLGGTIFGYNGEGIGIQSDYNEGGDRVGIYNGGSQYIGDWVSPTGAGYIIGATTAVDISASYSAWIVNGGYGAIIGNGDSAPVLNLVTSNTTFGGSEGDYPLNSAGAFIFNDGVLTSQNNPNFSRSTDPLNVNEMPTYSFDWTQLATDTSNFASFVTSGGASGDLTMLPSYGQTASDLLVYSEDGGRATAPACWSMAAASVRDSSLPSWITAIRIRWRPRPPCSAGS